MVKGTKTLSAVAPGELDDRLAPLVRRGDVEEDELVRAGGVVALGQLHGVARVAQVDEVRALDDAPAVDVQARDDPLEVHGPSVARGYSSARCASRTVKRPS